MIPLLLYATKGASHHSHQDQVFLGLPEAFKESSGTEIDNIDPDPIGTEPNCIFEEEAWKNVLQQLLKVRSGEFQKEFAQESRKIIERIDISKKCLKDIAETLTKQNTLTEGDNRVLIGIRAGLRLHSSDIKISPACLEEVKKQFNSEVLTESANKLAHSVFYYKGKKYVYDGIIKLLRADLQRAETSYANLQNAEAELEIKKLRAELQASEKFYAFLKDTELELVNRKYTWDALKEVCEKLK